MTTQNRLSSDHDNKVSEKQEKAAHLEKCVEQTRDEEARLDQAVEDTFPASDPVAELPAEASSTKVIDSEDASLDKAIENTFPASDPIAPSNITKIVPATATAPAMESIVAPDAAAIKVK